MDRTVVLVAVDAGRVLGSATIEMDATMGDKEKGLPPHVACLRISVWIRPSVAEGSVGHSWKW